MAELYQTNIGGSEGVIKFKILVAASVGLGVRGDRLGWTLSQRRPVGLDLESEETGWARL